MSNLFHPFVSVIIPVLNDSERLKVCLKALEEQTYPKKLYEVIVVDNGSDEDIEEVVGQFNQAFAACESRPSSYAARNKGVSLAKGDVIAFTDADCIPASDWIEKGVEVILEVPNCGLVAGKIEVFFKISDRPTAVELYESINAFPQQRYITDSKFGATANLFTLRSVIENVGYFNDTLKSGGDRKWGQRVFSLGYKQIYADKICVAHPARNSLRELNKKAIRLTGGFYASQKMSGYPYPVFFLKSVARDLVPLKDITRAWSNKYLQVNNKIAVTFVIIFNKHVVARERIRLHLGGKEKRG